MILHCHLCPPLCCLFHRQIQSKTSDLWPRPRMHGGDGAEFGYCWEKMLWPENISTVSSRAHWGKFHLADSQNASNNRADEALKPRKHKIKHTLIMTTHQPMRSIMTHDPLFGPRHTWQSRLLKLEWYHYDYNVGVCSNSSLVQTNYYVTYYPIHRIFPAWFMFGTINCIHIHFIFLQPRAQAVVSSWAGHHWYNSYLQHKFIIGKGMIKATKG